MRGSQQDIVVLKFGGTSVATPQNWHVIRDVLLRRLEDGARPIVVVSALAGVTNRLEGIVAALRSRSPDLQQRYAEVRALHEGLADQLGLDDREGFEGVLRSLAALLGRAGGEEGVSDALHARILAHGELASSHLGCAWLRKSGLPVDWQDARSWLAADDGQEGETFHPYLSVACAYALDPSLRQEVLRKPHAVTITQGFIARNAAGETVLLGRGGSDTSASYVATKVGAAEVEIWTDVPGVFTADPGKLDGARLLPHVTYDEAEAFASSGAKVLHPRCIGPLREHGIPLSIHWTRRPAFVGTRVDDQGRERGIKGVGLRENLCLLTLEHVGSHQQAHFLSELMACLDRLGITPDLLTNGHDGVQITLDPASSPGLATCLPRLIQDLSARGHVAVKSGVSAVSLVGYELRACLDQLGRFLGVLGPVELSMLAPSADGDSLTFVTLPAQALALHRSFHEALLEAPGGICGPTWLALKSEEAATAVPQARPLPSVSPSILDPQTDRLIGARP